MPIVPRPVVMTPPPDRDKKRLTLDDVELWCRTMRDAGRNGDAPVRGKVTVGGWLFELSDQPQAGDVTGRARGLDRLDALAAVFTGMAEETAVVPPDTTVPDRRAAASRAVTLRECAAMLREQTGEARRDLGEDQVAADVAAARALREMEPALTGLGELLAELLAAPEYAPDPRHATGVTSVLGVGEDDTPDEIAAALRDMIAKAAGR